MSETEYDHTFRTTDREAQHAVYNLQSISEELWKPLLQHGEWVTLVQAINTAQEFF